MEKIFSSIIRETRGACTRLRRAANDVIRRMRRRTCARVRCFAGDCRGDLATNTIGAIIVAVVIVGLLVMAVNSFFPGFFTSMFNSMQTKLNANW